MVVFIVCWAILNFLGNQIKIKNVIIFASINYMCKIQHGNNGVPY